MRSELRSSTSSAHADGGGNQWGKVRFETNLDVSDDIWGTLEHPNLSQSILFTNDESIVRREESRVPQAVNELCFIDEGRQVNHSLKAGARSSSDSSGRPTTASGNV
jgi:hypothetical protein